MPAEEVEVSNTDPRQSVRITTDPHEREPINLKPDESKWVLVDQLRYARTDFALHDKVILTDPAYPHDPHLSIARWKTLRGFK